MAKEALTEERHKMITTMKNRTKHHHEDACSRDTTTITKMHAAVDTSITMRAQRGRSYFDHAEKQVYS